MCPETLQLGYHMLWGKSVYQTLWYKLKITDQEQQWRIRQLMESMHKLFKSYNQQAKLRYQCMGATDQKRMVDRFDIPKTCRDIKYDTFWKEYTKFNLKKYTTIYLNKA